MKQTLEDTYGKTFLELEYDPELKLVYANYIGNLTLKTTIQGQEAILELLKTHNCYRYLNDNSNLVGGWEFATTWVRDVWFPAAIKAGLKYIAHVLAPNSRNSMEEMAYPFPPELQLMFFDNVAEARQWLAEQE